MFDVITVGSATIDAFIETDAANIVSVSSIDNKKDFMAYPYGAKIEIDNFTLETGGGAINTATNFASLGLKTSTIVKVGEDEQSEKIYSVLRAAHVDLSNIVKSKKYQTGFSIILTSFQGDRTVLAHRGANAQLNLDDINFEAIKNSKWLYLAPLNGNSTKVLDKIALYAQEHNVNLAINLGTSSIKQGKEHLSSVLKTAQVVILNKDEASMLTKIEVRPDTKHEKYSDEKIHPDVISMMKEINAAKGKITIITDGKNGVYAYDGVKFYQCDEFPANVVSTLGAGDAFSSTFVASFEKTKNLPTSLKYASVVAASVVEKFGAQSGFITFDEIEKRLSEYPNYKVYEQA
jgi:sugar/nucleoside kinase (ribokinase family)